MSGKARHRTCTSAQEDQHEALDARAIQTAGYMYSAVHAAVMGTICQYGTFFLISDIAAQSCIPELDICHIVKDLISSAHIRTTDVKGLLAVTHRSEFKFGHV